MPSGFFLGGAAKGLASGLDVGSTVATRARRSAGMEDELAQKEREDQQKRIQQFVKDFAAQKKGLFDSGGDVNRTVMAWEQMVNMSAAGLQAAGVDPNATYKSGVMELRAAKTPGEVATEAGTGQLTTAETIIGGDLNVGQRQKLAGVGIPEKDKPDITAKISDASRLTGTMLTSGTDPSVIRDVLGQIATELQDPQSTAALTALAEGLPKSQGDFLRKKTAAEITAAQPRIAALVNAGIPQDTATLMVLGKGTVQTALQPSEKFGAQELKGIRTSIRSTRNVVTALKTMIPLIDADTVGLIPGFSESVGGVLQNIPVVRNLANAIGGPFGLDKDSVETAAGARNVFRQFVGTLSRFITSKEAQRLSNQDREFARKAIAVLESEATPETARQALSDLQTFAENALGVLEQDLSSGGVGGPAFDQDAIRKLPLSEVLRGARK